MDSSSRTFWYTVFDDSQDSGDAGPDGYRFKYSWSSFIEVKEATYVKLEIMGDKSGMLNWFWYKHNGVFVPCPLILL